MCPESFARPTIVALGLLVALAQVAAGEPAQAHEVRFIASYGNNANLCTRDAPCVTLHRGVRYTPAGGELIILDSGDYGNDEAIGKSITISAVGVSATLGGPITIDAADAIVVLRGLRLNGANADANANGIDILAAAAVYIEDCEIQNFGASGISAVLTADTRLFVSGSVSRNNGSEGLYFETGSGGRLTVDNSRFERNGGEGLDIRTGEAAITRTIASGNNGHGIQQLGGSANVTWTTAARNGLYGYFVSLNGQMTLEQSVARGNSGGLSAAISIATVSNSVLTNNNVGLLVQANTTLFTRGNNIVSGNTTDVFGVLTSLGGI